MKASCKTYLYFFPKFLFIAVFIFNYSEVISQNNNIVKYLDGIKITDIKSDVKDIWVTTEGDGVFRYVFWKKKWINFSSANKRLKQDFFYCIETSKRFIWAGSTNGLYIYNKKNINGKEKHFPKEGNSAIG